MRHTIWGLATHGIINFTSAFGVSQTSLQMYMAVKKTKWNIRMQVDLFYTLINFHFHQHYYVSRVCLESLQM